MSCPFLKETEVKFCQMAGVRKMIPFSVGNAPGALAAEKCTSTAFVTCPVYRQQAQDSAAVNRCPWLQDSLMQYCGAAAVPKFVPYSEASLSRCGAESYKYCDLYLALSHPERDEEDVDGVRMPNRLRYSTNHMWLDVAPDGRCHAGVDGFLARALGGVEHISYVWQKGHHRPAAVLRAGGVDHQVVFPNPMALTACNLHLRADPSRLIEEPYTGGWLFEGQMLPETAEGLMESAAAREWMRREHGRVNEFIYDRLLSSEGHNLAGDGGTFCPGLIRSLDRDLAVGFFHEFFSPFASLKRQP
jgi:glycine cleavage system H lipoate-binding protein